MIDIKKWDSFRLAITAWVLPAALGVLFLLVGVLCALLLKVDITVSGPLVYGVLVLLFLGMHLAALARGIATFSSPESKAGVLLSSASLLLVLALVPMYCTRIPA